MIELFLTTNDDAGAAGPVGQIQWTEPGTYEWEVPEGVTSICALCIGQGQYQGSASYLGGIGGALRYLNNISVIPGEKYTITVGNGALAYNATTNRTSGFGMAAWYSSSGPTGSVSRAGGGKGSASHPGQPGSAIWEYGGSAAWLTQNGAAGSYSQGPNYLPASMATGIDPETGARVTTATTSGASAGAGCLGKQNTSGSGTGYPAGNGAFRIIWGSGRAYPSTKITNQ